jgi:predicted amidophosphoribosyltransferase
MKPCPSCKRSLADNASSCPVCGHKFSFDLSRILEFARRNSFLVLVIVVLTPLTILTLVKRAEARAEIDAMAAQQRELDARNAEEMAEVVRRRLMLQ